MIAVTYNSSSGFITRIVTPEADALGVGDAVGPFAASMIARLKGGSYDNCTPSCYTITRDEAGILTIPFQSGSGLVPTDFVWGSFITGEQIPNTGCYPSCALGIQAATAMDAAVPELFRGTIRSALQSWAALTTLSADPGSFGGGGLHVEAQLGTAYGGKHPAGQTIQFSAGGTPLCSAVTDASGAAACTARVPPTGTAGYDASFAGGNGLFASQARGAIPSPRIVSLVVPAGSLHPKAGGVFHFAVSRVRLNSGLAARPTRVTCAGQLAGKVLVGTGADRCTWHLAPAARGQLLAITVKAAFQSSVYAKRFSLKVT
jgi:hypothetical protein